ncbi:GTPase Era [Kosmotoga olearia]|uniref:GTPase Era n=1 Tax=Kosmotoga olearia (strain ATCC BAA-1733 / DSM 21960 / TBF 19.5.1) TaxID=521045 RepID=C5CI82_KOSOT|nr:GTPase Era [Kosmotoga olearia]ACR80784.1 GTP-binding protein Era [Kosmotoga olearia TBF 19.5.1]MDK2952733.1 GTPase [Kosmotoga sp.]
MSEKSDYRSGIVSLVGKPNVGKSSLVNQLVGEKVAIVSDKVQTTRNRIGGIVTTERGQVIFYDTPGIHKPLHKLGGYLVKITVSALNGSDLIAAILDISDGIKKSDFLVAKHVNSSNIPVFLVINKIDVVKTRKKITEFLEEGTKLFKNVEKTFPVSAITGEGIKEFLEAVIERMPPGPPLYPEDVITDRSARFMASEIIREKILLLTKEEVPHSVGVSIEEFTYRENGTLYIRGEIVVERPTQKAIIIGKGGTMIKKIGTLARQDMEYLFDTKVFLDLFVKVRRKWREKDNFIMDFTNLNEDLN